MKLPTFDMSRARWDDYKRFHVTIRPFVQFSTGELICGYSCKDPDYRHFYKSLDLEVVSTADKHCPDLYLPDGERAKTAWLTYSGQQILLIDRGTKRAVRLDSRSQPKTGIPADLAKHTFLVYFAGENLPPVGSPVDVYRPETTKEEWAYLREIHAACKAWSKLAPRAEPDPNAPNISWSRLLEDRPSFGAMIPEHRRWVAYQDGPVPGYTKRCYEYLNVKEG